MFKAHHQDEGDPVEIWIEFDLGKWRISPDPARIPRGASLSWRFRGDHLDARRARWTIYFSRGHPFTFGRDSGAIPHKRLAVATETFQLPGRQHIGTSPIVTADAPGDYKYGVRLEDLDADQELGDEDPLLIVF